MKDIDIKKLAKAMGIDPMLFGPLWGNPIFDPRKDANHDHAVLEWVNDHDMEFKNEFYTAHESVVWGPDKDEMHRTNFAVHYKIGDYARAALKVIDE